MRWFYIVLWILVFVLALVSGSPHAAAMLIAAILMVANWDKIC